MELLLEAIGVLLPHSLRLLQLTMLHKRVDGAVEANAPPFHVVEIVFVSGVPAVISSSEELSYRDLEKVLDDQDDSATSRLGDPAEDSTTSTLTCTRWRTVRTPDRAGRERDFPDLERPAGVQESTTTENTSVDFLHFFYQKVHARDLARNA